MKHRDPGPSRHTDPPTATRRARPKAPETVPAPVLDALENLKAALRLRLGRNPADLAATQSVTTILNTVIQAMEAH